MNRYHCSTGFFHRPGHHDWADWMYQLWWRQNFKYAKPALVNVLANGGCLPPSIEAFHEFRVNVIRLEENLGHIHDILDVPGRFTPTKHFDFCGWSAAMLAMAMIAYSDGADYVYCEQDCLMFGDCVGQMYKDLGDRGMVFGKSGVMPCEQSLFLIAHWFIPTFIAEYITMGSEQVIHNLPEAKFQRLMAHRSNLVGFHSLGVGRDRPLTPASDAWYFQKPKPHELRAIADDYGLLDIAGMPENIAVFSND